MRSAISPLVAMTTMLFAVASGAKAAGNDTTTVAILMFDGVQIIDFSAPYEVFGQAGFDVHTVSADGGSVEAVMGLSVNVDYAFDEAPPVDVIVVPGGNVMSASRDDVIVDWVRERSSGARRVLSVCTGSDIVAAAGLLEGRAATTFHGHFDHMAERFPSVEVLRDRRWVDSGKVVTSAGLASGIDAALHVVSEIRGETIARSVALHLEYDWNPDSGFIRGVLADRHLRLPAVPMEWPEGLDIDEEYAVGDKQQWEVRYRVTGSPMSPAQFIAHLSERAREDDALEVLDAAGAEHTAWRYRSEHGGLWRLEFEVIETVSASVFTLQATLRPVES